jgi:putative Mn2+ efflux pump MntP
VLALLLVALALGLSNFAAAISIGTLGVTARQRLEVGVTFGVFEAGMPVLGLALGHRLAHDLGHATPWFGGAILMVTGLYAIVQALRRSGPTTGSPGSGRGRLVLTSLALSFDNLAIGFALGTRHVSIVIAAIVVGAVSVAMSLVGLELGSRLGAQFGQRGELLAGFSSSASASPSPRAPRSPEAPSIA